MEDVSGGGLKNLEAEGAGGEIDDERAGHGVSLLLDVPRVTDGEHIAGAEARGRAGVEIGAAFELLGERVVKQNKSRQIMSRLATSILMVWRSLRSM